MAPGALWDEEELQKRSSPVPPYPGFDLDGTYSPDCPVPRVKWGAEDYLNRNRGSIDNWAFYGESIASPRPEPRCPTRESVDNWTHGRHGTIKPIIDGFASPRPETAPPRIKTEAEGIACVSRGFRMCNLITKYGEFGATPRVARVKPEAEDTATTHKGGRMKKLVHSYGKLPLSARGVPRVKIEGEDNADLDKGKRMNKLIHSYAKQPQSARAVPRVKTEGEDNADLDKGKRMNNLIHKYGRTPLSARAVPRVKTEGEDNADLDKGKRMDRLVHSCETLPKSPRSPPRVKHVEGRNNSVRGRGSMGKLFREMGNRTCVFQPGVKKKSYLKTAMM
ncbi:uncharacterized protein LOC132744162 [Ruditapes philippinarum]|uniref:uncharacterized protein LOC132744162 n=1 Tax=Ruditapes philippinarum TaxID=129788 RepID=UPI00295BF005|nr:uncharacterized protein LOC132744162 [Ruditapes philippinarum]